MFSDSQTITAYAHKISEKLVKPLFRNLVTNMATQKFYILEEEQDG